MAAHLQALLANYYGLGDDMKTILEGVMGKVSAHTSVRYRQGALMDEPNRNPIDWFSGVASESDVTIACLGISQLMEGEEGESIASRHKGDRVDIALPQNQIDFLKTIRSKAKKLVVVMTGGSAIACPEVLEMADAFLFVWYPGEQGGAAVGDILFGDAVPSGRLPVTFPMATSDLPPYEDYAMKNRTYRYASKEPLFPFGFGLSYTSFEYSNLKLDRSKIKSGESINLEVQVKNTGNRAADEIVQLYLSDLEASVEVPIYALKAFQSITLNPGQSQTIRFTIDPKMMELINEQGKPVLESGQFKVYVGGSLPSARSVELGASPFVETHFEVE